MPLFRIYPDGTVDRVQVTASGRLKPSSVSAGDGSPPRKKTCGGAKGMTVTCPGCGASVRAKNLSRHQRRRCAARAQQEPQRSAA